MTTGISGKRWEILPLHCGFSFSLEDIFEIEREGERARTVDLVLLVLRCVENASFYWIENTGCFSVSAKQPARQFRAVQLLYVRNGRSPAPRTTRPCSYVQFLRRLFFYDRFS